MDATEDDGNKSREPVKEPKEPTDFADRLSHMSDGQLKKLAKLINDEVKSREGKSSILGQMSDKEFSDLKEELSKPKKTDKDAG